MIIVLIVNKDQSEFLHGTFLRNCVVITILRRIAMMHARLFPVLMIVGKIIVSQEDPIKYNYIV